MQSAFPTLLSSIQRIEGYDRQFAVWWWVGLAVIALMILLACWKLTVRTVVWWRKPRSNPVRLFKKLMRLHRLNAKEKALLCELAPKLPRGVHSAILFVDPASWSWSQVEDPNASESLEKLYIKIFGIPRDRMGT